MEYYAILVLGFYLYGMVKYSLEEKWVNMTATGINVLIWSPFLGRAMGWW